MRYYLNIPLPKTLEDQIKQIEKQWQGDSRSDPHITIIVPREAQSEIDEAKMIKDICEALIEVHPFLIILGKVGYFGDKSVIYLSIARTSELVRCHSTLVKCLEPFLEKNDSQFSNLPIPHITLATRLNGEKAEAAWQELKDLSLGPSFLCQQIKLLKIDSGKPRWRIVRSFPLI